MGRLRISGLNGTPARSALNPSTIFDPPAVNKLSMILEDPNDNRHTLLS